MTDKTRNNEQYDRLLEAITPILLKKGLKTTTMDNVATALGISKRTLYEIFESKNEMIFKALQHNHDIHRQKIQQVFIENDDFLENLINVIFIHRNLFSSVSAAFFRDMDTFYRELRSHYNDIDNQDNEDFLKILNQGASKGIVRGDINFRIQIRMLKVQMESLKRMERLFPPEITLLDIYDNITSSFLRSIVTPAHIERLDSLIRRYISGNPADCLENTPDNNQQLS